MDSIKIYVAAHKPTIKYGDKHFRLIHVGAALHPNVEISGAVKDNSSTDNISAKNGIYCELTALYYMWKSVHDVANIGLCHYRRYFVTKSKLTKHPEKIIVPAKKLAEDLTQCDIILGKPGRKGGPTKGFFTNPLDVPEFCVYRNILPSLNTLYPEYVDTYYQEFFQPTMSYCNMMVCSKTLFDEYCEFLFSVLFDAERRWKESGIGVAPREMGYISEYLLNTWVRYHHLKTKYYPIGLFEDTTRIGFKVHYALQSIGLNSILGPLADKFYQRFLKK